jgi:hypothetical protein
MIWFPVCSEIGDGSLVGVAARGNSNDRNVVLFSSTMQSRWVILSSNLQLVPSGKNLHNYGKSQFFMGKFTIHGDFL